MAGILAKVALKSTELCAVFEVTVAVYRQREGATSHAVSGNSNTLLYLDSRLHTISTNSFWPGFRSKGGINKA